MRPAPADVIYDITIWKRQFSWPEMECLALVVLSILNLLRISQAWSADRNGLGKLIFKGEKNQHGVPV